MSRPQFPKRAVITAGMPYGNKGLHFGHVGGVFVPADFFARFLRDRIGKENVLFVSGTDCYGSPIMEGYRKAFEAGEIKGSILDYVKANHDKQKEALDAYDISLDIFAGSGLEPAADFHNKLSDEWITTLYERGVLTKRTTRQFFDEEAGQFLNGRQVKGRCPIRGCKSEKAYADECDLGHQFDPEELIAPVSQLTGTTPVLKPVDNWYFDLPKFEAYLKELNEDWKKDPQIREVITKTVAESLVAPTMYLQNKVREDFEAIEAELPAHTLIEPQGNQSSFALEFKMWEERDIARDILDTAKIRFRTGKCLLPLRITGNIEWGVPAPKLDGTAEDLTVWVWPESLWAPISFVQTALAEDKADKYSSHDWKDWWANDDAQVFQFIGQDNIYFYCVAQPGMFKALEWGLKQTYPVANYHILFMNKKASSSGAIKPPMALELLDYYTPDQLRCHWLNLGLDTKAVSFSPKPFDTSVSVKAKGDRPEVLVKDDPRVADPALKESAFLTNIFNRLARSCFYGAKNVTGNHLPQIEVSEDVRKDCNDTILKYEEALWNLNFHQAFSIVENFCRAQNKLWDSASKQARNDEDDKAYEQALADALCALRTTTLLMHPAVPDACEQIARMLGFDPDIFFNWDYAMLGLNELCEVQGTNPAEHTIDELPPRFDFFKKHESQY